MKRPFKTWLVDEHADADTPVGDLARDVQSDPGFPAEGDRADLLRYLSEVWGADASLLDCFAEAWRLYEPDGSPADRPFAEWLLETYAHEGNTPLGNFARQFAPLLPETGDRAALRAALLADLGGVLTPFAVWTLECFDEAWREYDPTCAAPGCTHRAGEAMPLCDEHVQTEGSL